MLIRLKRPALFLSALVLLAGAYLALWRRGLLRSGDDTMRE